jgi:hypothetical protein
MSNENTVAHAVLMATLARYHEAMVDSNTVGIAALTTDDFVLVHLTGYQQPRAEWFDVVESGEFDYHRITPDPGSISIDVDGASAAMKGRGGFDATIYGTLRVWPLAFDLKWLLAGRSWRLSHATYRLY